MRKKVVIAIAALLTGALMLPATSRQLMVAGGLDRATPVSAAMAMVAAMAMAVPSPMRVMATGVAMDSTVGTRGPAATCMPIAIVRTAASGPFAGDPRHSSLS